MRRIPAYMYLQAANISGNSKMKRDANRWNNMLTRYEQIAHSFTHFTIYEWIFVCDKVKEMNEFCTENELKIFQLDVSTIDWIKYLAFFCWGMQRNVLKELVDPPDEKERRDLLARQEKTYFSDIKWALTSGYDFKPRNAIEMKRILITSPRVQEAIRNAVINRKDKKQSEAEFTHYVMKSTNHICDQLFANYSLPILRLFAWTLNKIFKQIYEKVVVDEHSLERIMNIDNRVHGPIVLIPTHRSYIDFLIVSYIFFAYGIKCPHIAAAEDFLSIKFIHKVLRSSGAFFVRRKKIEFQEIYRVIFYEYVQKLLLEDSSLEFFIEGTRSRSGKTLPPRFGMLNIVVDTYLDKKLPDLQIIPITINYERVLEGETFPFELLGEDKVKESFSRIITASSTLRMNFGRVYVEFNEPVSLKKYVNEYIKYGPNPNNFDNSTTQIDCKSTIKKTSDDPFNPLPSSNMLAQNNLKEEKIATIGVARPRDPFGNKIDRKHLINELGFDITYKINERLVIMPTSMVASIVLMNRKGITEENLINKMEWLKNEIMLRGAKIGTINESGASIAVRHAIGHLEQLVNRKKDIFHPSVSAKADYKNILLLSYYRNQLIHIFLNEAICACALVSFGREMAWKEGVSFERLWEEVAFLQKSIRNEYVIKTPLDEGNFRNFIEQMVQNGVFAWSDKNNSNSSQAKIMVIIHLFHHLNTI